MAPSMSGRSVLRIVQSTFELRGSVVRTHKLFVNEFDPQHGVRVLGWLRQILLFNDQFISSVLFQQFEYRVAVFERSSTAV